MTAHRYGIGLRERIALGIVGALVGAALTAAPTLLAMWIQFWA